jgi:DNA-binding NtrC family response regulator
MDIPLLLNHFMKTTAEKTNLRPPQLSEPAEKALLRYSYPGNVRELANIVERLFVLCSDGQVTLADLPAEILDETSGHSEDPGKWINDLPETGIRLQEMEKALIVKTLEKTSGNKAAAARMMGMTRRRLYIRIMEYGIVSA